MALTPETRKLADKLTEVFLVPFSIEKEIKAIREHTELLPEVFSSISETFIEALSSTIQTTAVPFLLANRAAHNLQYQRFAIAERIRARSLEKSPHEGEDEIEKRRDRIAIDSANSKIDLFSDSEDGVDSLAQESARSLLGLYKNREIQMVARELLLQGTIATWSALEMLIGDGLTLLLDLHPEFATKLLSDSKAKNKFELPRLTVDDLAERDFDLSKRMGQLLFGERDLSSLPTLKCACEAIIDSPSLREKLSNPSLWRLNQNRHLIVHRRGLVDEEYCRKTGSSVRVGDALSVSTREFEDQVLCVLNIGREFLAGLVSQREADLKLDSNT